MSDVRVERDGDVLIVVMARPDRHNAVDGPMSRELAAAFREFEASDAKVAVLAGDGPSFCAGADLKGVGTERSNPLTPEGDGPMGPTRLDLDKPVIAAINGHAVAGGLELALWCDLRVADDDATLGVFCRRWGVPLIDGGTIRLPRLIGHSRAMDLILTGRPVEAAEALDIGLVNRVVPSGTAREAAVELAKDIARMPQTCMRGDRRSARSQWSQDEPTALLGEYAIGMTSLSRDGLTGAARFAGGKGRGGSFDDI
ncbi:enoyl-CoA hydratase/isomerase family protein [Gordonia hirsuta DSM 44140 = NBRC 16056]|uniref:Enoyl-CoA hydratase/isomerase family protein n=1 Tax=Gordonia hirsuta DSM 44140 = NBRC 16056 TaxID=1121927 RepID=L7LA52_9ACTN|nr:crotonase/enoyl-CoA hydratase family protein [Gordonia hirsuta]GAC57626.1 enoyl-CoA hydratase/isomerase family protein [Gordonia hirsuta DSM 44140 = NBRC 16056]